MKQFLGAVTVVVRDYEALTRRGVHFREIPRQEPYGKVAVFEDLYGNRWDLLQTS